MNVEPAVVSTGVWQIVEDHFDPQSTAVQETIFTLANGFMGLRGAHEERFGGIAPFSLDGSFINGLYESAQIHHPEAAYALAKEHQYMLNVPNAKCINIMIGDEQFDLTEGNVVSYLRVLDFRAGVLSRDVVWTSPKGKSVAIKSRRVVSFVRKNLFAIEYQIQSLNFRGVIEIRSTADARVKNVAAGEDPRFGSNLGGGALQLVNTERVNHISMFLHKTRRSDLAVLTAVSNELECEDWSQATTDYIQKDSEVGTSYRLIMQPGDSATLTKYGAYFVSLDFPVNELTARGREELEAARKVGFQRICEEQSLFLSSFWQRAEVRIDNQPSLEQGVRFNQFQLLQSVGRNGRTSIAAKGLTGEGYGGHYFWDAEIYALPFYLYTQPEIARELLLYRFSCLNKSRDRAREMSHKKGALYAWRTIGGEECSAFFPAGTAAYHINADIAFAVKSYYEATDDEEFLLQYGAEMVWETARIWMDIGHYSPKRNHQFCIHEVTGPDEYTAMVDNNFYTNAMAQMHLQFAAELANWIGIKYPDHFLRLSVKIRLELEEPAEWLRAAKAMYIPYDDELRIHPQDDTFLSKKKWNLNDTPKEHHPLLLHYHYLVIYRHQVCKQADVLLALLLLGDRFPLQVKQRDYDYYEPITTHDSSLSPSTFGILASEVGYHDKAYSYFVQTARGDLDNAHGNTAHGVHIAAMAGTWMAIVYGFAGMRAFNGNLEFTPMVPRPWSRYSFRFFFKSALVNVAIDFDDVEYTLIEGDFICFEHHGLLVELTEDSPTLRLPTAPTKQVNFAAGNRIQGGLQIVDV